MLKLKVIIDSHGLKQKAVAERMGRSESWLSNIMNGRTRVFADDAARLAAILNEITGQDYTVDDIVGEVEGTNAQRDEGTKYAASGTGTV